MKGRQRLSAANLDALNFIREHPGCRVGDVRRYLGCSYSGAAGAVFSLRLAGFVKPPRKECWGEVWPEVQHDG